MSKCTERGCRNLEWKCADCGRVASTATFPPMQEWISVKDRVPEIDKDVLVFDSNTKQCSVRYRLNEFYPDCDEENNKYAWNDQGIINSVTHWMPLPEPPKEII